MENFENDSVSSDDTDSVCSDDTDSVVYQDTHHFSANEFHDELINTIITCHHKGLTKNDLLTFVNKHPDHRYSINYKFFNQSDICHLITFFFSKINQYVFYTGLTVLENISQLKLFDFSDDNKTSLIIDKILSLDTLSYYERSYNRSIIRMLILQGINIRLCTPEFFVNLILKKDLTFIDYVLSRNYNPLNHNIRLDFGLRLIDGTPQMVIIKEYQKRWIVKNFIEPICVLIKKGITNRCIVICIIRSIHNNYMDNEKTTQYLDEIFVKK